jgi:hypothetical protein
MTGMLASSLRSLGKGRSPFLRTRSRFDCQSKKQLKSSRAAESKARSGIESAMDIGIDRGRSRNDLGTQGAGGKSERLF